ncbi:MAG: hypothetical protein K6G54_00500 [Oscillospiraceae bacterium]|nr:hypothetical protein [Oscillospiraceae bacterium]
MILSKQQKYILGVVRDLGCVKREQLLRLYMAHASLPEDRALRQLDAMLLQMRNGISELRLEGDLARLERVQPNAHCLEAIDVMLELTGGAVAFYKARLPPPLLLRFALDGPHPVVFVIIRYDERAAVEKELRPRGDQRVVWLSTCLPLDAAPALPPGHFLAVRKQDGTHGFYGSNEL